MLACKLDVRGFTGVLYAGISFKGCWTEHMVEIIGRKERFMLHNSASSQEIIDVAVDIIKGVVDECDRADDEGQEAD